MSRVDKQALSVRQTGSCCRDEKRYRLRSGCRIPLLQSKMRQIPLCDVQQIYLRRYLL